MPLPRSTTWTPTMASLRQAARLLGVVQRLTQEPQPAYLELALQAGKTGFFTGRLPMGGQARLDLAQAALVYTAPSGEETVFSIDGCSQAELFARLFGALAQGDLAGRLPEGCDLFERVSKGIVTRGRYRAPRAEQVIDGTVLHVDPGASDDFLSAVHEIYAGLAGFEAHLLGLRTPLVVWPEEFDLSSLIFVGKEVDEEQPHLNFGFAPFSEEDDPPYLYAYAYPYPAHYNPPTLPDGAEWHTRGWTGVSLPYERIAIHTDPGEYVEEVCLSIYPPLLTLAIAAGDGHH